MELDQRYPAVAHRDCDHCKLWQYDETTGKPVEIRKGTGLYHRRYSPLPCESTGCPKGTPEAPQSLNERNRLAYRHYLQCRAVSRFPDDPIVSRNAAIIRGVIERVKEEQEVEFRKLLIEVATRH